MKASFILLLILMTTTSFSQNFVDLANVYYRMSPGNTIEGSSDKMNFNTFATELKIPVPINDNNVFITALECHKSDFNSTESPSMFTNKSFTSFGLQLGLQHDWSDKFNTLAMVVTRYNTDFSNKSFSNNFQIGGVFLNKHKRSESFTWKYGLYYNGELFGPMFVPLFGFIWQINEKTKLNITAPVNLELRYTMNKKLSGGLRFDGVNGSYFLTTWTDFYVDRADNNVWLFNDFYITKNLVFHLKAGYSVLRKYRTYYVTDKMNLKLGPVNIGDGRFDSSVWFDNGWSFEARMIFRLPLD